MAKPRVIVLRTAGTNCDMETAFAFEKVGADAELVHINRLIAEEKKLKNYQILAIPGGFTYGDDIASGKILANELKYNLKDELIKFIKSGKIVIGICNGFQVLVKSGFLPNTNKNYDSIESTLSLNDSAKFEDRWVYLRKPKTENREPKCIWARGMDDVIYLPVAHGEGKFIPKDNEILNILRKGHQVVFRYCDAFGENTGYPGNPNGSLDDIAGICDTTGRVFGLMPHPERHIFYTQHPRWTRLPKRKEGDGLLIFRNGVEFINNI